MARILLSLAIVLIIVSLSPERVFAQTNASSSPPSDDKLKTITDWAQIIASAAVAITVVMAKSYYDERKARRLEKELKFDEQYDNCANQYYEISKMLIDDEKLLELYANEKSSAFPEWNKLSLDEKKFYKFYELNYYVCKRVYRLRLDERISLLQWLDWDLWIKNDLINSKTFCDVYEDVMKLNKSDFEIHVGNYKQRIECKCKVCNKNL